MPEDKLTNNELKIIMDNLTKQLDNFEEKFDKFCIKAEQSFVSKKEFKPVQKIVYGAVGTILTTIVAAGLYLIMDK